MKGLEFITSSFIMKGLMITFYIFLCILSLIPEQLSAQEIKEFWMLPNDQIKIWIIHNGYPRPASLPTKETCHFKIEGNCEGKYFQKKPHYKIIMNSLHPACVEKEDLNPNSDIFQNYIRVSYEEAFIYQLRPIQDALKEEGVTKGKSFWLKTPVGDISGLSKVILIRTKYKKEFGYVKYVLLISDGYKEHEIEMDEYKDLRTSIASLFSETNPGKGWGKRVLKSIKEQKVLLGMTPNQAIAGWGRPEKINKTIGEWGVHEQWVYRQNGSYLYFENGKLKTIQD